MLVWCGKVVMAGEPVWTLKKDAEGIKVYTGTSPHPNIKAVRVECRVKTTLSRLAALLLDAKAHEEWIYNTKVSYLVEQISPQEQLYYSEIEMPWPLSNRDVVINLKLSQDRESKVMTVIATAVQGHVPGLKDKVRVTSSQAIWKIVPVSDDEVEIEYVGWANPGGSVPPWAVNLVACKGPFETFKRLRGLVNQPAYYNVQLQFVQNFKPKKGEAQPN